MAVIDLRAKRIDDTSSIWVVHTGRNSQCFDIFEENGIVLLEYPDLRFTSEGLGDDARMRRLIRRSQAIRANRGLTRENGDPILAAEFLDEPEPSITVALRTIRHLAERMKVGDLVLTPGKGTEARILIGEVAEEFNFNGDFRPPHMSYASVPYRKVNWLSKDNLKRDLPPKLQKYFEKPPAIARVQRDAITNQFFDFAYRSYVSSEACWSIAVAPTFDGTDLRSVLGPTSLVVFAVSLVNAAESGNDYSNLSYEEIIARYYNAEDFIKLSVSYNSPGEHPAKSSNYKAMFVAGFIALAACGALGAVAIDDGGVQVVNSISDTHLVDPTVQRMINNAIAGASPEALNVADSKGVAAAREVGFSSSAVIVED